MLLTTITNWARKECIQRPQTITPILLLNTGKVCHTLHNQHFTNQNVLQCKSTLYHRKRRRQPLGLVWMRDASRWPHMSAYMWTHDIFIKHNYGTNAHFGVYLSTILHLVAFYTCIFFCHFWPLKSCPSGHKPHKVHSQLAIMPSFPRWMREHWYHQPIENIYLFD